MSHLSDLWKSRVFAALVYLVLMFVVVRPLLPVRQDHLPIKQRSLQVVAMFNAWTIWWNAESAFEGWQGYWNAPIFQPENDSFAYSEPQPATLVVAPIIWFGGSPAFAYQIYLFLSLFLNSTITMLLSRRCGQQWWLSLMAGGMMLMLPLTHRFLDVIQLVPIWAVIWVWFEIRRWGECPSWKTGLLIGFGIGLASWMSLHQTLLMTILLLVSVWPLIRKWELRDLCVAGLPALLVGCLMVLPLAMKIHQVSEKHDFARSASMVEKLSARPSHYVNQPTSRWNQGEPGGPIARQQLGPGWMKFALALLAFGVMVLRRRWNRWILFLMCTCVTAFLLSLGPTLQIGDWVPWTTLVEWLPGVAQVRSAYRFAFFYQIAVVLLAVEGLKTLAVLLRAKLLSQRTRRIGLVMCGLLGIAAVVETWPVDPIIAGVPSYSKERAWVSHLREHTPNGKTVACFPFAAGNGLSEYDLTARWMYYGTMHRQPLVNGYSGFFPQHYFDLRRLVNESFPSHEVLEELRSRNVEYLVVLRSRYHVDQILTDDLNGELELILEDSSGIDLYRLKPR